MVRSAYLPRNQPDAGRIAAISASIALNIALFMFLMQPPMISAPEYRDDTPKVTPPDFIKQIPPIVPITPTPPTPHEPKLTPVVQKPMALPRIIPPVINTGPTRAIDIPVPPQPDKVVTEDRHDDNLQPKTITTSLSALLSPAPNYPILAMRDGSEGIVQLEILVGVDGSVVDVRVVKSSGDRRLDAAAREQVLHQWRFQPAVENGVPVQARGILPVVFKLQ